MSQSFSKLPVPVTGTISSTCINYVHPWTDSCLQAMCGLYLYAIFDSLRIYGTVYTILDCACAMLCPHGGYLIQTHSVCLYSYLQKITNTQPVLYTRHPLEQDRFDSEIRQEICRSRGGRMEQPA